MARCPMAFDFFADFRGASSFSTIVNPKEKGCVQIGYDFSCRNVRFFLSWYQNKLKAASNALFHPPDKYRTSGEIFDKKRIAKVSSKLLRFV